MADSIWNKIKNAVARRARPGNITVHGHHPDHFIIPGGGTGTGQALPPPDTGYPEVDVAPAQGGGTPEPEAVPAPPPPRHKSATGHGETREAAFQAAMELARGDTQCSFGVEINAPSTRYSQSRFSAWECEIWYKCRQGPVS